jgi:UDP-N-acetylglucosamine 2-epimerase
LELLARKGRNALRIAVVQGTRPEIIKNYSVVKALRAARAPFEVLDTGQHCDRRMSSSVYAEMGYEADRVLRAPYSIGAAIEWLQRTFAKDGFTQVIVNGDTAAALAGAVAGMYSDLEVAHIEAGLRSGDALMREERNRIMVDSVATTLFAYTSYEARLLATTPSVRGRIYLEGNTTVDVLHDFADQIAAPRRAGPYVYVTLHRKELTDSRARLTKLVGLLRKVAAEATVVFPVHPRTVDALRRYRLGNRLSPIEAIEPVPPIESLALQKHARVVMTDSGCVQEEAYLLGVPCITLRENTERHLTVANGANIVTGFSETTILEALKQACEPRPRCWPQIYGAPGVGGRIVGRLLGSGANRAAASLLR